MAVVILDCDGVLSDFVGGLFSELKSKGFQIPDQLNTYEIFDQMDERSKAESHHILNSGEFWATMPVIEEAAAVVDALKAENHDIVVATTPWGSCMEWGYARRAWLTRNLGLRATRVITVYDKHLIHGDVIVDDKPETVTKWQNKWQNGKAFLMNRPWNTNATVPCPRINWDEEGIQSLLQAARALS